MVFDPAIEKLFELAAKFKKVKNFGSFNYLSKQKIIKCTEFLVKCTSQDNSISPSLLNEYNKALEHIILVPTTSTFNPRLFRDFEHNKLSSDSSSTMPLISQHASSLVARAPKSSTAPRTKPASSRVPFGKGGKQTRKKKAPPPELGSATSSLPNPPEIASIISNARIFDSHPDAKFIFRAYPSSPSAQATESSSESDDTPTEREKLITELREKANSVITALELSQPEDGWDLIDFAVSSTVFPDSDGTMFYRVELCMHCDLLDQQETLDKIHASFVDATLPTFVIKGKPDQAFTQLACYAISFQWSKRNQSTKIINSIFGALGKVIKSHVQKPTAAEIKSCIPDLKFTTFVAVDLDRGMAPRKDYLFTYDHQIFRVDVKLNSPLQACSFCHIIGHSIPTCALRHPCHHCVSQGDDGNDHCYLTCHSCSDAEFIDIVDSFPDLYMQSLPATAGAYAWMSKYITLTDDRIHPPVAESDENWDDTPMPPAYPAGVAEEIEMPDSVEVSKDLVMPDAPDAPDVPDAPDAPAVAAAKKATAEALAQLPAELPRDASTSRYLELLAATRNRPQPIFSYASVAKTNSRIQKPASRSLESNFGTAVSVIARLKLQKQSTAAPQASQQ
ncbi:unnamed protein product [Ambrosiozyma monospora]|uniref:Unnamed protein product n=1 Tax=Ambrosiozyma monospora TaxID=43982 RepID=A0A9W6YYB7_AMBMO|nr:unnamed protein product [Ambrosiozyma monospora]